MSLVELMNWWMLIIARYDADRGCPGAIMWPQQSLYQENQLPQPRPWIQHNSVFIRVSCPIKF